ncbi:MAG: GtrA family protein [Oscillospiraceae bacterium]|nr:GtrA family protein [Oscillospiraceae bacterium]
MKKGKQPVLYALSSVASWVVDTGAFYLLHLLLSSTLGAYAETVCNIAARVVSSFFNFNLNNRLVFRNTGSYGRAMLRYYCLAIPQLAVSTLLIALLVRLFGISSSQGATGVKIVVDGCLFVASFFIQKFWVFARNEKETDQTAKEKSAEKYDGSSDRKEKQP